MNAGDRERVRGPPMLARHVEHCAARLSSRSYDISSYRCRATWRTALQSGGRHHRKLAVSTAPLRVYISLALSDPLVRARKSLGKANYKTHTRPGVNS